MDGTSPTPRPEDSTGARRTYGPEDTYRPAIPTQAECPHCGALLDGAPDSPHLRIIMLNWLCPACGGEWSEIRGTRGAAPGHERATDRFYEPGQRPRRSGKSATEPAS